MTNPENPWDTTIWDPINPEQAIEDPFHGPEAVMNLLSTPPMPMPDGTYHVFGASSIVGTCDFDTNGKPFIKIGSSFDPMHVFRFEQQLTEWHKQLDTGELPEGYPESPDFFDFTAKPYFVLPRQKD